MKSIVKLCIVLLFAVTSLIHSQTGKSFFPMEVGNQWIYETSNYPFKDTIKIAGTQKVNGILYFAFQENSAKYFWFREDNLKIYIVDTLAEKLDSTGVKEYLLYDFGASPGNNWDLPLTFLYGRCEYGGKITFESSQEIINSPAGSFNNCIYFSRLAQCSDAGRTREYFAQGVGRTAYYENSFAGTRQYFLIQTNVVTGINENPQLPDGIELYQNYPNPFNPSTVISYMLPEAGNITLKIYDLLGREMITLVNEYKNAGLHHYTFYTLHSALASGIYFYKLESGSFSQTKKLLLIK